MVPKLAIRGEKNTGKESSHDGRWAELKDNHLNKEPTRDSIGTRFATWLAATYLVAHMKHRVWFERYRRRRTIDICSLSCFFSIRYRFVFIIRFLGILVVAMFQF